MDVEAWTVTCAPEGITHLPAAHGPQRDVKVLVRVPDANFILHVIHFLSLCGGKSPFLVNSQCHRWPEGKPRRGVLQSHLNGRWLEARHGSNELAADI
jgi:hypothetical protein